MTNEALSRQLSHHFSSARWRDSTDLFPLSGWSLVAKVNRLSPRFVVDIGCGFNLFKKAIPNLIGIDLVNEHADLVCDFADAPIAPESIDVALALGSINFGDAEDIRRQLRTARSWLAPYGLLIMRGNPGEPIGSDIPVFEWSAAAITEAADAVGFTTVDGVAEETLVLTSGMPARRLVWTYQKA